MTVSGVQHQRFYYLRATPSCGDFVNKTVVYIAPRAEILVNLVEAKLIETLSFALLFQRDSDGMHLGLRSLPIAQVKSLSLGDIR